MVSVTRALGSSTAVPERSTRASPELDANLRTCRAQMADWVTCPSAKTPEGKAKIEQIAAKLDSIKQQIEKSDAGSSPERIAQSGPRDPTGNFSDYASAPDRVGGNVDTYA